MRIARCPVRLTEKQWRIETRRRKHAQLGGTLRQIARLLGVSLTTAWNDRRAIQSWDRLPSIADPEGAYRSAIAQAIHHTWGQVDRKLEKRLRRILLARHGSLGG